MMTLYSSNARLAVLPEPSHQQIDQQRTNQQCCEVVDKGIMVQNSYNTVCAIEYLKSHNVAPQVIERVLLHPELRRKLRH
jgi:hypothetical protein